MIAAVENRVELLEAFNSSYPGRASKLLFATLGHSRWASTLEHRINKLCGCLVADISPILDMFITLTSLGQVPRRLALLLHISAVQRAVQRMLLANQRLQKLKGLL